MSTAEEVFEKVVDALLANEEINLSNEERALFSQSDFSEALNLVAEIRIAEVRRLAKDIQEANDRMVHLCGLDES